MRDSPDKYIALAIHIIGNQVARPGHNRYVAAIIRDGVILVAMVIGLHAEWILRDAPGNARSAIANTYIILFVGVIRDKICRRRI